MKKEKFNKYGLILLLITSLFLFDKFISTIVLEKTDYKHYWLFNKNNETFDLAFMGSSRVLNTIDADLFNEKSGLTTINLGLSGIGYAEQYLMLKLFTDKNKIKKLFLEISYFSLINPDSAFSYPFHEYCYFPYINNDDVFEVVKNNSKSTLKSYAWKYLPFFKYSEFNVNFRSILFMPSKYNTSFSDFGFDKYGSVLIESHDHKQLEVKNYSNSVMDKKNSTYLNKIIELTLKNKIELVLFTSPVNIKNVSYSKAAKQNFKDFIKKISSTYKINYFDFESQHISYNSNYFLDNTHLNKKGAKYFSNLFCDTLISSKIIK